MDIPLFSDNPLRTRTDLQRLLRDLVSPILPHFSEGCAQVRLGDARGHFGDNAGWLEGFARPLWGLVPLAAGGGDFEHLALWQRGIASGTDPDHPEYWGLAGEFDQRSVEQAAFGLALALAPELFWEPLPQQVRSNLAAWLQRINQVKLVQSNWLFFRILANLGLRRCGCEEAPETHERLEADFASIERFHRGNGWYEDGAGGAPFRDGRLGDYYVPMAFQFYSLVYARLTGETDPARARLFKDRARDFAQDFQHWFSADGSALPFGRSLTYRFAQGAFWGALAYAEVEALPWPVIKGLYLRHLRWWMKQPIFTETGLLSIGYTFPNERMAESYNSAQSPYWALKTFLPLALPEDHPFWQAQEAPLPPRSGVKTVPGANLILVTSPGSREVTAINPGQPTLDWPRNAPHKYSKCAYSTRFGFCVPTSVPTPAEGGLDSVLSLSDDGRYYRCREQALESEVGDGVAFSRWVPWPDVEVRSWLIAEPTGHLRIHRIATGRKLWSLEGGFAVPWKDRNPDLLVASEPPQIRTPFGASILVNLLGERKGEPVDLGAGSHLLASLSSMPTLRAEHAPGEHLLACWVAGSADPREVVADAAKFRLEVDVSAGCRLFREGELWWSQHGGPCGTSSDARIQWIHKPI